MTPFFGLFLLLLDLLNNARLFGSIKDTKGRLTHVKINHHSSLIIGSANCPAANFPFAPACFILPALGVIANYPAECNIAVNLNTWRLNARFPR